MSNLRPEELTFAEQLMYEAKFDEALEIITNFEKKEVNTSKAQLLAHLLKGRIYSYNGQYLEALEVGELAYKMSQKMGRISESIDALLIKARVIFLGKLENAFDYILEAEKLLNSITNKSVSDFTRQQADLLLIKSTIYYFKVDNFKALELAQQCLELREKLGQKLDISRICWQIGQIYLTKNEPTVALNYAKRSLEIQEELGNQVGIAASLCLVGLTYYGKGNFDNALKFCKKSLLIKKISHRTKLDTFHTLGAIYREKGELNRSLRYYKRAVKLAEKLNYSDEFVLNLLGMGAAYRMMGDYDQATEKFKLSLSLSKDLKYPFGITSSLFYLILISLDINSRKQAQRYLQHLEELVGKIKSKVITQAYIIAKAMVLKTRGRIRSRTEAEILLKQIVEDEIAAPQLYLLSLVNLCDLFLEELYMTNNLEILDEINPLINKIFKIAEKRHSYLWLAETKLLQAKLALIQMNIGDAKQLLTQAQQVAEMNGLNLLAIKISSEYDDLLEQLNVWDNLKKKDAPMSERMKLASLNVVIDRMQGKRTIRPPKLTPEVPVLLLIIAEGGIPLFSNPFTEEFSFENEIFGSFLTAFNDFSGEFFSKGLDRAKFGDYTILLQSVGSFLVCYLFKGQTYLAKQKLKRFTEHIQYNASVWQSLNRFNELNQIINVQDLPSLESIITEIFISKSIKETLQFP